jgi:RHS repeat-associated protein
MREVFKLRAFVVAIFTVFVIILLMKVGRSELSGTESIYYYHLDHLGTPLKLTDQNKNIVWSIECSPFMEFCIEEGDVFQPLRFPGQYYDEETGLHYNWNRYYKPEWGRYVEPDPWNLATSRLPIQTWPIGAIHLYGKNIKKLKSILLGRDIEDFFQSVRPCNYFIEEPKTQNLYDYAISNPIIFTDPYGLFKCDKYCFFRCVKNILGYIEIGESPALAGCLASPNPLCCVAYLEYIFLGPKIGAVVTCGTECCKKEHPCEKMKCQ